MKVFRKGKRVFWSVFGGVLLVMGGVLKNVEVLERKVWNTDREMEQTEIVGLEAGIELETELGLGQVRDLPLEETGLGTETGLEIENGAESDEVALTMAAGVRSLGNLLATAREPVGRTMYVWGGGWNEEDTGAGIEAVSIGVSARWEEFARKQDRGYDYKETRYQIHDGLDCSGYVGWIVYNVFETEAGEDGYVMKAAQMAKTFASYGWGEYTPAERVTEWKAGDIMSMKGHVWMALGMCEDGSVVLMHASPPGVRICGTELATGGDSQAIRLAEEYMARNYPEWYERYSECGVKFSYLQNSSQMRWNAETLSDDLEIQEMGAEQVLKLLYP